MASNGAAGQQEGSARMRLVAGIFVILCGLGPAIAQQPLPYYPQFEPAEEPSVVAPFAPGTEPTTSGQQAPAQYAPDQRTLDKRTLDQRTLDQRTLDQRTPNQLTRNQPGGGVQLVSSSTPESSNAPESSGGSTTLPEVPANLNLSKGLNRYLNPDVGGRVPYFVARRPQATHGQNPSGPRPLGTAPGRDPYQDRFAVPPPPIPQPMSPPIPQPMSPPIPAASQDILADPEALTPYPALSQPFGPDGQFQQDSPSVDGEEHSEASEEWIPEVDSQGGEAAPGFKESPVSAVKHHVGTFYSSTFDRSCERSDCLVRIPKMFGGNLQNGAIGFSGALTGTITSPTIGAGAFNVADNGSPIPTDRAFVTYQRFYNGLTTSLLNGAAVEETEYDFDVYTAGIEKTFFNQRVSVEARMPFVDTELPEEMTVAGADLRFEPGIATNVSGVVKGVLWENEFLLFSAGVGMRFTPGSDSTTVRINQDLVTYEQGGVDFAPFLGFASALYWDTFVQGIVQYNLPTDDDQLTISALGTSSIAAIRRQQSLNATLAAGKWLFSRPGCFFSGMSLISEANYSTAFGDDELITLAPGTGITTAQITLPRYDTLSISSGMTLELWSRLSSRAAVSFPLLQDANRFYDTELQGSINWRF